MIVFSSVLNQIFLTIPDNTEIAIYCHTYYVDKEGTVFSEPPHGDVQILGDVIIETGAKQRYRLKNLYAAYQTTSQIIQYLSDHRNENDIVVDLDRLDPEVRMLGEFASERI